MKAAVVRNIRPRSERVANEKNSRAEKQPTATFQDVVDSTAIASGKAAIRIEVEPLRKPTTIINVLPN